ncbi:glycosyltransferase family 90 protein, partial [Aureobasidium melanogenum]|uniref:Glycosyl transferase CAP10 domain-containing protein n=1 Tax=Aureobasidium melanogenum (strain CBS 110374) TaxID=1043003 RepID=A0A074W5J7_AURM1
MESLASYALIALTVASWFLAINSAQVFAYGSRTLHVLGLILASIGASLLFLSRYLARSSTTSYDELPLDETASDGSLSPRSPVSPSLNHIRVPQTSLRKMRLLFVLLVLLICARAETTRRLVRDVQCLGPAYTEFIPLCLAVVDFCIYRRHKVSVPENNSDLSIYELLGQSWATNRFRYIIITAIFGVLSASILHQSDSPSSTYICTPATHDKMIMIQRLALVLDFCISFCLDALLRSYPNTGKASPARSLSITGWACLLSASAIGIWGVIWFLAVPEDRFWVLEIPRGFIWKLIKLATLCCIAALSTCITIFYSGAMSAISVLIFVASCSITISWSWHTLSAFPPDNDTLTLLSFCGLTLAFIALIHTQVISEDRRRKQHAIFSDTPIPLIGLMILIFCIRFLIWLGHVTNVAYHPIDLLIHEASDLHKAYTGRAYSSANLTDAVIVYRHRYGRNPPPNFHEWYRYAIGRNSLIIDEFDKINEDLLPFWTLVPSEIRDRTWQTTSNPWNDVSGISIRKGKAEISPHAMATHRWMLDGIVDMISHFSEFLPDMDLGFNVNDECRVAVPYENIQARRQAGNQRTDLDKSTRNSFSEQRGDAWKPIPEESSGITPFIEMSWQKTFNEFGVTGCPPGSAARSSLHWDTSHLCTSCVEPHSLGAYLSNWTLSADICHQPDIANLHGFYLSPAAFKATHELYPVFSQSKVHGYNDILYPSAWNYMDKAKYNPNDEHPDLSWDDKIRTLFWRGGTSEGVSCFTGVWKGMARQRFMHLANNIASTLPAQPILLPYPFANRRKKLAYVDVPASELTKHVSVDVKLVEHIVRCGGPDCEDQEHHFAPMVPPTDFQTHWSYRYLLDLDGAAFSGRFIPFLQSRSLPFKAALFREWWDDRLTPWLHFVPLDLRGHGFWATLVYFMGLESKVQGKQVMLPAHDKQAEYIAEAGREWSNKVLRKEDMEIYMFRLLLEWGRMTDDKRDELGLGVEEAERIGQEWVKGGKMYYGDKHT